MLSLLIILILSDEYESLGLDDTYHEIVINNITNKTFWIQPSPSHSAILVIHNQDGINGYKKLVSEALFKPMTPVDKDRSDGYIESRYTFTEEDPLLFRLTCNTECSFVVNYVHTDPVYRTSAILGAFGLFVCLFLFVFSWAIFCGSCRATRIK